MRTFNEQHRKHIIRRRTIEIRISLVIMALVVILVLWSLAKGK